MILKKQRSQQGPQAAPRKASGAEWAPWIALGKGQEKSDEG